MATFELQIVTPDGEFFNGQAERIITRTIAGDVCIMAKHINYVTAIGIGEARVTIEGKVRRAACSGGLLTTMDNHVRLVATTFEWEETIDTARAKAARDRAQKLLDESQDGEEMELAKAKLSRALNRIRVGK